VPGIWVHAEVEPGGAVRPAALELLTKARSLADDVSAVLLGPGATEAAGVLGEHGAARVLASDDPVYAEHGAEPAAYALAQLAREAEPDLVLLGSSYGAREVAGRVQALLGCALVANVDDVPAFDRVRLTVALSLWPGRPGNLRAGVGGEKRVEVALSGPRPRLVLARPRAFDAVPCGGRAEVVPVDVPIPDARKRLRTVERREGLDGGPRLEDARVVVAGGRGLEDAANLALLDELADAIGDAAVGATRPLVDAGWVAFSMQIGQTGKTVKPDVYIAVGISGAAQHTVGMRGAGRIVAINTDRNAPIFEIADLGIVGDARVVVPSVVSELARRRVPELAGAG
jgi:electron transfer flavoprotein alpha subunit